MFLDEIEQTERRRSSRIIALEERKERERQMKALARMNISANDHVNSNKGKDKETIDVGDNEDEHNASAKKGRKCKALHQLFSSTQEGHPEFGSTSRRNVSSLNSMPEKHVLEFVLDLLQRKDPDELFAEPVNPDVVENYYQIVKQPMDFATMRAKLHENMYSNFEQFKRDVYLICSNAMNANPATTAYHRVAEAIHGHARKVFEGLRADPEHFDLEFSLNKRRPCRKPQGARPRTSRLARLPPRPPVRNYGTHPSVPEIEKRSMYWPPSNQSLHSEFLNAYKPCVQLNHDASNYRDSLLRFVEDLGPVAQKIAAKKLAALEFQQLLYGDTTPTPNLLENISGTQTEPTPQQSPTQQPCASNSGHGLSLSLPLSNRPLTILGDAQENRNVNTIAGDVNISDGSYKGKRVCVEDGWDACAAALLGSVFLNSDKGESSRVMMGGESSNIARGNIEFWGPSKDTMVSSHRNVSSVIGHAEELQLGANLTGETAQWNTTAGRPDLLNKDRGAKDVPESSSRVRTLVWPTMVISGPQPKPLESGSGNSLSGPSFFQQPRPESFMSSINDTGLSLVPQPRAEDTTISGINHSGLSLVSQPRPEASTSGINPPGSGASLLPQPRPAEYTSGIDLIRESLLSQLKLIESISNNNRSGQSTFHSQAATCSKWNEPETSLHSLGTPCQPGDFQNLLGSTDFNNNPYPVQVHARHEHVLNQPAPHAPPATSGFSELQMQLNQLNSLDSFPVQHPKLPLAPEMPLGEAINYYGVGSALRGQSEETTPRLLWHDDHQPNLSLQL